ncbi:hypothetical protein M514_02904, partial [Trichuris suis]
CSSLAARLPAKMERQWLPHWCSKIDKASVVVPIFWSIFARLTSRMRNRARLRRGPVCASKATEVGRH